MTDSQKWLVFAFVPGLGWLIYLLTPVLMPFAFAAMLAYLGDPLTDKLETCRLSRTHAVLVVFSAMTLIFALVLLLLVPLFEYQLDRLLANLPAYVTYLNETVIPWGQRRFHLGIQPVNLSQIINLIKSHWEQAGGIASTVMSSVSHSGGVIVEWLMNLLLIPVVTFYLLRDWDGLIIKIHDLLPRRVAPVISKLAVEADTVLAAFLRGQLYVMLALGCIYSIGLWMVGLDLALLIGMLAGLVSFVPYLGAIVGIVMACIAAFVKLHELIQLLPVAIVFIIGQSLESMLLTPMLVGDKIGLHPVAVMFAVLAGGQLFGFLLALPVASIIMVLLRHAHDLYRNSDFYGRE